MFLVNVWVWLCHIVPIVHYLLIFMCSNYYWKQIWLRVFQ